MEILSNIPNQNAHSRFFRNTFWPSLYANLHVRSNALLPLCGPANPGLYQYESSGYASALSSSCMRANSKISLRISPGRMPKRGLCSWRLVGAEARSSAIVTGGGAGAVDLQQVYWSWGIFYMRLEAIMDSVRRE